MRRYGITYDTGFVNAGVSTHEQFDPDVVGQELRIIRDDLHCTAVRVTGSDPDRLEIAARHAADLGIEVWFSPFTCDLTTDELLGVLVDCADRAERLRRDGADVVLVTGAELSLFTIGFLPGDDCVTRLNALAQRDPATLRTMGQVPALINEFLGTAVRAVRERFGGRVGYAAIWFEGVDWTPFDFVSQDVYRTAEIADRFRGDMATLVAQGKPVALTEFGCGTFQGAADVGARMADMVEWDGPRAVAVTGDYTRDEAEQATCLREQLDVFAEVGVDTVFLCTFACYHLPYSDDPRHDLDLASGGVVKVYTDRLGSTYPTMAWEPKASFHTIADYYRAGAA